VNDLQDYLVTRRHWVDAALEKVLPATAVGDGGLHEAMRYGLLGGGKRLRPILLLASGEAVGASVEPLLPYACAVEMIHAYSLIHDDLPAMDDDQLRRGRPTCHVRFGESLAILAGDGLLTEAFRLMGDAAVHSGDLALAVQASREIAAAAGAAGMVGGQAADLAAEGTAAGLAEVESIHRRKTGALILASIRSGAILAGCDAENLACLTRFGEDIGMAFQIADDVLDADSSVAVTGKVAGRDRERGKRTFAGLLGVEEARRRAAAFLADALTALEGFPESAEPLRAIARLIVERAGGNGTP
jgi:geranylgeranyl diphosphate synthase type II